MTNLYVSYAAWAAMPTWASLSSPVSLGAFCRQTPALMFLGWSGFGSGSSDVATINFGATSFNMSAPSGFTAWDNSGTSTFDPSNKGAGITLSGGNLTATRASASAWNSVRSTTSKNTGKFYFEITCTTKSSSGTQMFGMCNATESMSNFLGVDTNGIGLLDTGTGENTGNWQGVAASGIVGIAIDLTNNRYWVRTSAVGNWNNSTLANPTTGIGGYTIGGMITEGNERAFVVTTAGTLGSLEPTWNLNNNVTTNESGHGGTAVWTQVAGQESRQSAGNWTAPLARVANLPGGGYAIGSLSAAAGDQAFLSSDHSETNHGNPTVSNLGTPCGALISVSRAGATLPPTDTDRLRGAAITMTGTGSNFFWNMQDGYVYGVDCYSYGPFQQRQSGASVCEFENGSFQLARSSVGDTIGVDLRASTALILWTNTYANFTNSNQQFTFIGNSFEWRNTVSGVQGTAPTNLFNLNAGSGNQCMIFMHGLDLSLVTSNLFQVGVVTAGNIILRDSKLASGVGICGAGNSGWGSTVAVGNAQVMVDNCDDTSNSRAYRMFRSNCGGSIQSNAELVRAGGNTDGVTGFSWKAFFLNTNILVAGAGSIGAAIRFPEIQQRFPENAQSLGTSETLTVYGMSAFAAMPTNANLWAEVEYLGSSASPIVSLATSRVASPLVAGTNLTADTSNWTANVSARQNSHAYSVGDLMVPSSNTSRVFVCTTAGTSASSLPGGYATAVDGGSVTDGGTCVFMALWRWSIALTFTPHLAGTIKTSIRTTLTNNVFGRFFLVIDPAPVVSP